LAKNIIPSFTFVAHLRDMIGFRLTEDGAQILASSSPLTPPPLAFFEASLSHLWSIWECILLCEPILVFGHSPAITSQAIWWFRDLIRPVWFGSQVTVSSLTHPLPVEDPSCKRHPALFYYPRYGLLCTGEQVTPQGWSNIGGDKPVFRGVVQTLAQCLNPGTTITV
jgi:hypothetical protein